MQRTYTTKPVAVNSNGGVIMIDPITVRVSGGFNLSNEREVVVNLVKSLIADSFRDVVTDTSNEPVDGGDADPSSVREVVHTYYRLGNAQANLRENHLADKLVEITNMLTKALIMVVDDHDEVARQLVEDIHDKMERITYESNVTDSALHRDIDLYQDHIAKLTGVHPNADLS